MRAALRALWPAEHRFRRAFSLSQTALAIASLDGRLEDVNAALCRLVKCEENRLVGLAYSSIVHPADADRVAQTLRAAGKRDSADLSVEHRLVGADGEARWVLMSVSRADSPSCLVLNVQDVTGHKAAATQLMESKYELENQIRKRTEDVQRAYSALAASADRSRAMFNQSVQSMGLLDRQGTVRDVNLPALAAAGVDHYAVLGRPVWETDLWGGEYNGEILRDAVVRVASGELPMVNLELRCPTGDGSVRVVDFTLSPVCTAQGRTDALLATGFDITERNRVLEELERARRLADAANVAKSAFLANMSHEIRTPMNAVLGFAELLQRDALLTPDQRANVDIIVRSGRHLLELLNNVLEVSKIEDALVESEEEDIEVYAIVRDLQRMFSLPTEAKGLSLSVEMPPGTPRWIRADGRKLRQIAINLLGNAVKFTERGGISVLLSIRAAAGSDAVLSMEVRDTGTGIDEASLERIFERFEQGARAGYGREGSGLGLAISREYAQVMGGELTVDSEPGRGSAFCLEVPVVLLEREGTCAGATDGEHLSGLTGTATRTLIVDDHDDNRVLLTRLLEHLGIQVRDASNGRQAVRIAEEWQPHLVLMDLTMPEMDGFEATRRIKALQCGADIVVVAVSARAFAEDRQAALDAGASGFLRKPFDAGELYAMVREHLDAGPADAPEQARSLVEALPADLVHEMRTAVLRGDLDELADLVERVSTRSPSLATHLRDLAYRYDYERLHVVLATARG